MSIQSPSSLITEKWADVLNEESFAPIHSKLKRTVTAQLIENTLEANREFSRQNGSELQLLGEAAPTNSTGSSVAGFDPILISMIRRSAPNLMAYDVCGVQPMTGPTGLVFAMHSRYTNQTSTEAFYNEPDTSFSTGRSGANTIGNKNVGTVPGTTANTTLLAQAGLYNYATGVATANLEAGFASGTLPEMAFDITKQSVTAVGRGLKAEYSIELAQDLRAIHGLDAEAELQTILTTEILGEINREVIRAINVSAVQGSVVGTTTAGIFDLDTDSNGRWSVERFKGLMFHIEREANKIAKDTRRGKGNIIICSSDVASALAMAGVLDFAPALQGNQLDVDDTGNTFVGVLNGRYKVYVDPYTTGDYMTIGFKGASPWDAGLFYCPYVPLQLFKAVDPSTFQPKIAFKTRYGMVPNPFAKGTTIADANGAIEENSNKYYRRTLVTNIM